MLSSHAAANLWKLPDNPNPDDSLCFELCIPNDPAYISAFLGQMYDLSIWNYWDRDDAHTALVAAGKFREIFGGLLAMGNCHEYIRQSTTDPCTLEKSDDGGTTWTAFAELDLCPPSITVINGIIYFRNPLTGVLSPIGDTGNDPRSDGPQVIPYPGGVVPSGQTAQCLSAVNIIQYIKDHIQIVINNLNASASFAQTASGFLGFLTVLGEVIDPINIVLTAFLQGLVEAGSTGLSAAFDDTNMETLKCILEQRADSQGSYNNAAFLLILADVDREIGGVAAPLIGAELETLGFQGLNRAATSQKLNTGDCAGCGCESCVDLWIPQAGYTGTITRTLCHYHMESSYDSVDDAQVISVQTTSGMCRPQANFDLSNTADFSDYVDCDGAHHIDAGLGFPSSSWVAARHGIGATFTIDFDACDT